MPTGLSEPPVTAGEAGPALRSPRSKKFLPPGWPLFALFAGFPLWWVLGLGQFASIIFAVPMAVVLLKRKPVRAPRGLGAWLLFLLWVAAGVFVLQVDAPGTVTGDSSTRYLTFAYRLCWYLSATVVLLYVGNTRERLSNHRIASALSWMFVVVVAGGLLGVVAPHLEFRSALEYVLPHGISSNGFVQTLVHPTAAQVQKFLGYEEARPSAPFSFTNDWGLNFGCFLPFFLITWLRRDAGWKRWAGVGVLLVALVPVIYSLNRGLWGALLAAAVFVAVRYALMGRVTMLVALLAGAIALGAVLAFTPLGSLVELRLAHPHSNEGRTNLGSATFTSTLQGSPLVGFGSTRNVQGTFSSIAAGATADCPRCAPPPLGTQGQLWLVMFSQGFVGLLFYVGFFLLQFLRHVRLRSPYAVAGLTVIVVHLVTLPVYSSVGPALFGIMIAVGLLWRSGDEAAERAWAPRLAGGVS